MTDGRMLIFSIRLPKRENQVLVMQLLKRAVF